MTSVSACVFFSYENVRYIHVCSYTRYYYYHYYYIILQVQGRTETDTDIQNGQESRTVQVSYILLIFSAYLLLKTSDNVLAIKGVYKRANAFLDIHVFRYINSMLVSFS